MSTNFWDEQYQVVMTHEHDSSLYIGSHDPSQLTWSHSQQPLGTVLHLSNEPAELLQ